MPRVRVAVVDIGTNSTRLLVADVADSRVSELERRSTVTRLGRGVDTSGQLAGEAVDEVCRTVAEYIEFHTTDTTMRDRFGVVPSISFDEGLRRLVAYFACQPTS